jgi:CheY-like chemotaxis protein
LNGDRTLDWMLAEWPDSSPEEVADALWLAALGVVEVATAQREMPTPPPRPPDRERLKVPPTELESPVTKPTGPAPVSPQAESHSPEGELALPSVTAAAGIRKPSSAGRGIALRVPGARALPGAAEVLRALRPLRRRVESRRQFSLDIEATVNRIAAEGLWMPIMRSARARWLDLALVIEDSRTMVLWRETLRELRRVLEQAGAFRDVRVWWLDSTTSADPVLRVQPDGAACKPGELIAADGRRVVLLATDCLSSGWDSGALPALLRQWGARQPVALLQMLPRHLWSRTALYRAAIVHTGASQPGMPNRRLQRLVTFGPSSTTPPSGMVVPVLTTEPELVAAWARLVGTGNPPEMPGVIFPVAAGPSQPATPAKKKPVARAPEDVIRDFRQLASKKAFRLASLLAAAPLRLPVMRLVQRTLLPESGQVHLAEVFLGGIIRRVTPAEVEGGARGRGLHRTDPDLVDYDFQPGVRSLLLDAAQVDDAVEVQTRVSKYLADRFGQRLDFRGMLKSPEKSKDLLDFQENSEFARVSAEVLRRMGKEYAQVARRLETSSGSISTAATSREGEVAESASPAPASEPQEEAPATIPAVEADRTAVSRPAETDISEDPFTGARILWVDDHPKNNDTFVREFERAGARVQQVNSSEKAIDQLEAASFDAIISDLKRGNNRRAGVELLQEMRRSGIQIPFAVFCGKRTAAEESDLQAKGALICTDDFAQLRPVLAAALSARKKDRARFPKPLSPEREETVRAFLRAHGVFTRFSHEENDASQLLEAAPSELAWKLLWAELWREASEKEAWTLVVQFIEAAVGSGYVQVFRADERTLTRLASLVPSGANDYHEASLDGIIGRAARTGETVLVADATEEPDYIPAEKTTRSELAIPIPWATKKTTRALNAAGVINIESSEPNAFRPVQVGWLRQAAASLVDYLTDPDTERSTAPANAPAGLRALWHRIAGLPPWLRSLIATRMAFRWFALLPAELWVEPTADLVQAREWAELAEIFGLGSAATETVWGAWAGTMAEARRMLRNHGSEQPTDSFGAKLLAAVAALISENTLTGEATDSQVRQPLPTEWLNRFILIIGDLVEKSREDRFVRWLDALEADVERAMAAEALGYYSDHSSVSFQFEELGELYPPRRDHFTSAYPPAPPLYVWLIGSQEALPEEIRHAPELVGRVLAASGLGLISGSLDDVYRRAQTGFASRWAGWEESKPSPQVIAPESAESNADIIGSGVIQRAAAILLLAPAVRIVEEARRLGVPVLFLGKAAAGTEMQRSAQDVPVTSIGDFRLLIDQPMAGITVLPRLLRNLPPPKPPAPPSAVESTPTFDTTALIENTFGLSWEGEKQPRQTAFLLRTPRVIVTDAFGWSQHKRPKNALLWDSRGRVHSTQVLRVGRGGRTFGPLLLRVPRSINLAGLPFRERYEQGPGVISRISLFTGILRVIYCVAAGERKGVAGADVISSQERSTRIEPVEELTRVIRIAAEIKPGASGAPTLDEAGAVCGFIVGGHRDISEAFLLPGYRWLNDLKNPPLKTEVRRPIRKASSASRKTSQSSASTPLRKHIAKKSRRRRPRKK